MKNLIKLMLLMGLTASVNVWSMSEKQLSKKEDLSEEKEKEEKEAEEGLVKLIKYPHGISKDQIKIDEAETFTCETFSELIKSSIEEGKEFILARVVTENKGNYYVHYYDASELNKYLINDKGEIKEGKKNPKNALDVKLVEYFVIKNEKSDFEYLCSNFDFCRGNRQEEARALVKGKKLDLSEEKEDAEMNCKSIDLLGKKEFLKIGDKELLSEETFADIIKNQIKKNEEFILARVVTKDKDNYVIDYYDANRLNKHFYKKYPVEDINVKLMNPSNNLEINQIQYFTIKQSEKKFKYLCSNFDLLHSDRKEDLWNYFYLNNYDLNCYIEQFEKYKNKDKNKAILYAKKLICDEIKDINLVLWGQANLFLADELRSKENYKEAIKYYEKVAISEIKKKDILLWAKANLGLGKIYGQDGLDICDYKKSRIYFQTIVTIEELKKIDVGLWAEANAGLINIYNLGHGLNSPNYEKAKEYCQAILSNEQVIKKVNLSAWMEAILFLGTKCYVNHDNEKAKKYFEKLVTIEIKNRDLKLWAEASHILGHIYYKERLRAPDYKRAEELWEKIATDEVKSADLDLWINANNNLGHTYYEGKLGAPDYQKAKKYWEKIATSETRNADLKMWATVNNNLGSIYYEGKLGALDYQKAKEYLEKIVIPEVKNVSLDVWAKANNSLGIFYHAGYLGEPDYRIAKEYYEKVATDEVKNFSLVEWSNANYNLGVFYYEGKLETPDCQKAKEYWEKVATYEIRNADLKIWAKANNCLGAIYYEGKLGAPDYKRAKKYYEQIATDEVKNLNLAVWAKANNCLSSIYCEGKLGAPDYQKAKEYLEKVAIPEFKNVSLSSWADANISLGNIYYHRRLLAFDYKKAKEYYEKVATDEVKNVNLITWAAANANLGSIYYHGRLGTPDYKKAKEYYRKLVIDEVKNVNLDTWNYAKKMLTELEKIAKEKSAEPELVN